MTSSDPRCPSWLSLRSGHRAVTSRDRSLLACRKSAYSPRSERRSSSTASCRRCSRRQHLLRGRRGRGRRCEAIRSSSSTVGDRATGRRPSRRLLGNRGGHGRRSVHPRWVRDPHAHELSLVLLRTGPTSEPAQLSCWFLEEVPCPSLVSGMPPLHCLDALICPSRSRLHKSSRRCQTGRCQVAAVSANATSRACVELRPYILTPPH